MHDIGIEEIKQASLLYDFYGQLLTERQREAMRLYHDENLSLGEIARDFDISRQGVYDALKNAEKALKGYEEKLGLVDRFQRSVKAVNEINGIIEEVIGKLNSEGSPASESTARYLKKIKEIIDKLEE